MAAYCDIEYATAQLKAAKAANKRLRARVRAHFGNSKKGRKKSAKLIRRIDLAAKRAAERLLPEPR